MTVRRSDDGETWTETYRDGDGRKTFTVETPDAEIEAWCRATIAEFNATLRPHERAREYVSHTITRDSTEAITQHQWRKTNLVTLHDRGRHFDTVRCSVCGITGRRYGIAHIVRGADYRAKAFETCSGAIKLLAKRQAEKSRA